MFRAILGKSLVKSFNAPMSISNIAIGNFSALTRCFSSATPNIAEIASKQPSDSSTSKISATKPLDVARTKHKTPRKRASSLHDILKKEERDRLINGRVYPELVSGDSVRIEKLPYASAEKPDIITGVIIAKYNKTYDTRIDVLNMVDGVGVRWMVRIHDPLVKSISIIDKRFAYRFKKTTRSRSKLYYLFDKDPTLYQVKNEENDARESKKSDAGASGKAKK